MFNRTFFVLLIVSSLGSVVTMNTTDSSPLDGDSGDFYGGDSYENIKNLQDSLLSSDRYSPNLRPLVNQSQPIVVSVTFSLVAVVAVDNVKQELVTNGFLFLFWDDQRNTWDPKGYGGIYRMTPSPNEIWRPRLLLINTLGKRDPFEDDYTYTVFFDDGRTSWIPGGLFHTYCALDMEKFPFDVQNCKIQLCPMSHTNKTIQFVADDAVNLGFYYPNPGWDLLKSEVTVENISVVSTASFSCPTVSFQLKRRPTTIVLNVIVPVIFLSVLNNLVFLIPVDSGEKVSYAITVLLALTVFLSMVSTMTPQVSDVVPALTIYLFVLLLSSVLTVGAAIFTIFLHNLDEREESSIRSKFNFQNSVQKVITLKKAVAPLDKEKSFDTSEERQDTRPKPRHNPYRVISKHVDKLFFLIINGLTIIMNVWYFTLVHS